MSSVLPVRWRRNESGCRLLCFRRVSSRRGGRGSRSRTPPSAPGAASRRYPSPSSPGPPPAPVPLTAPPVPPALSCVPLPLQAAGGPEGGEGGGRGCPQALLLAHGRAEPRPRPFFSSLAAIFLRPLPGPSVRGSLPLPRTPPARRGPRRGPPQAAGSRGGAAGRGRGGGLLPREGRGGGGALRGGGGGGGCGRAARRRRGRGASRGGGGARERGAREAEGRAEEPRRRGEARTRPRPRLPFLLRYSLRRPITERGANAASAPPRP